jgi:hypothetical protein
MSIPKTKKTFLDVWLEGTGEEKQDDSDVNLDLLQVSLSLSYRPTIVYIT